MIELLFLKQAVEPHHWFLVGELILLYFWEGKIELVSHFLRIIEFFQFALHIGIGTLPPPQLELIGAGLIRILIDLFIVLWGVFSVALRMLGKTDLHLLVYHLSCLLYLLFQICISLHHHLNVFIYNIEFLYPELLYLFNWWRPIFKRLNRTCFVL